MRKYLPSRRLVALAPIVLTAANVAAAQEAINPSPIASPEGQPPTMTLDANKTLVRAATDAFFNQHDPEAVDRYVSPVYVQHSSLIGDGLTALRDLVAGLGPEVSYEPVRLLADGDLVAAHGRYLGFGPEPLIAFDLFRIENGLLAEHWDGLQAEAAVTASGHTQLDGPTTVADPEKTETSRELVERFVDTVLIGEQYDQIPGFFDGDAYVQHNPDIADGVSGLGTAVAALAEQGLALQYNGRHRTIAEGEFVLVHSDGNFGRPVVYFDLFRVENGSIAEHWDVIQDIPAAIPHENGLF